MTEAACTCSVRTLQREMPFGSFVLAEAGEWMAVGTYSAASRHIYLWSIET